MRTPDPLKPLLVVCALSLGAAGGGHAFDGPRAAPDVTPSVMLDAFPVAEETVLARWSAARRHSTGQGARLDHWQAFQIYARIAATRFESEPSRDDAPYVGGAMREMGRYYLTGIEGSPVASDPRTAESYLYRAAALFGDADAQFELGRFYLDARWGKPRERHAARWFALASRKGHAGAQAELGALLCEGRGVARNASRGIVLMATALRNAPGAQRDVVQSRLNAAFAALPDADRQKAENALQAADLPPVASVTVASDS